MVRNADSENKYISIIKTDTNKSNELSKLLKDKAQKWLDIVKKNWTFELNDDLTVAGPDEDSQFSDFIFSLRDNADLEEFFDADMTDKELKELCEYIYDEVVSQEAYEVIKETIENEKEEFKEDFDFEYDKYGHPREPRPREEDFFDIYRERGVNKL